MLLLYDVYTVHLLFNIFVWIFSFSYVLCVAVLRSFLVNLASSCLSKYWHFVIIA